MVHQHSQQPVERSGLFKNPRFVIVSIWVLFSFLAAIALSKWYWGYFFYPPALPSTVSEFETIRSVTPVVAESNAADRVSFKRDESQVCLAEIQSGNLSQDCARTKCNTEYCESHRVLLHLSQQDKLPTRTSFLSPERLTALYQDLEATGLLRDGAPGYGDAKHLRGFVVEASDRANQQYIFVAANGGQVENDHYAYYEFLFQHSNSTARPHLVLANQFFYDIAGLELMEWWILWIVFSAVGGVIYSFITVIRQAISSIDRL